MRDIQFPLPTSRDLLSITYLVRVPVPITYLEISSSYYLPRERSSSHYLYMHLERSSSHYDRTYLEISSSHFLPRDVCLTSPIYLGISTINSAVPTTHLEMSSSHYLPREIYHSSGSYYLTSRDLAPLAETAARQSCRRRTKTTLASGFFRPDLSSPLAPPWALRWFVWRGAIHVPRPVGYG